MKKSLDEYKSLKEFYCDIEQNLSLRFPLKVMGKSRPPKEEYTSSMLGFIYSKTPDPDQQNNIFPVETCFGKILNKGCRLDPDATYSAIQAPDEGKNIFQGDVIPVDLSVYRKDIPSHKFGMIASHSCEIDRSCGVQVIPVFRESELTDNTITFLRTTAAKNYEAIRQNWLENISPKYIAFPPFDLEKSPDSDDDEPFIAALALCTTIPLSQVPDEPVARLKYRALSFLQWRIGLFLMRDVQRSDETREF